MPTPERGPILICTNCGTPVNPLRVMLGGKKYICINCNQTREDGTYGSARQGYKSDSPKRESQSFKNDTRNNKINKKKKD